MATKETIRSERREEARRMLSGYRAWVTLNDQVLKLIENIESRQHSVKSQIRETRSGGVRDSMTENLAALEDQEMRLRGQSSCYATRMNLLLDTVNRVVEADPLAGQVLALRYMELGKPMDFNEIAERLEYSHDHIVDKHRQGLEMAADVLKL